MILSAPGVAALPAWTISYPPLPTVLGVSPHGILAAAGIAAGAWLLRRRAAAAALPVDRIDTALLWAIPAGIVGSRLDYVISHPGQFHTVWQALALWRGGLALFGGLIAGFLVACAVLRHHRVPILRALDAAAPAIPLAIAIGRIGDLLLTDHLGRPSTSPLALTYRVKTGYHLAPGFGPSPAVPPGAGESCTDLGRFYAGCSYQVPAAYDLIGAALLALLLLLLARRHRRPGLLIAICCLWYATQRLLLDFTRGIDERPLLGMTGTQLIAAVLVPVSLIVLVCILRRPASTSRPGPTAAAATNAVRDPRKGPTVQ